MYLGFYRTYLSEPVVDTVHMAVLEFWMNDQNVTWAKFSQGLFQRDGPVQGSARWSLADVWTWQTCRSSWAAKQRLITRLCTNWLRQLLYICWSTADHQGRTYELDLEFYSRCLCIRVLLDVIHLIWRSHGSWSRPTSPSDPFIRLHNRTWLFCYWEGFYQAF